jgi:hypothetical protein
MYLTLDELERAYGLAKLFTVVNIFHCVVESGLHQSATDNTMIIQGNEGMKL